MYEVQFVQGKNISTKNIGVITIFLEVNEKLFEILRHSYDKVFHLTINFEWKEFKDIPCNINTDWNNSLTWQRDHWLAKIDVIWWDVIAPCVLTGGNLFIKI